jgi:hypothetical protein
MVPVLASYPFKRKFAEYVARKAGHLAIVFQSGLSQPRNVVRHPGQQSPAAAVQIVYHTTRSDHPLWGNYHRGEERLKYLHRPIHY